MMIKIIHLLLISPIIQMNSALFYTDKEYTFCN